MAKRPISRAEMLLWQKIAKTVSPLKTTDETKPTKVELEDFGKLLSGHSHLDSPRLRIGSKKQSIPKPAAKVTELQRKLLNPEPEIIPKTALESRNAERKVRRGQTIVDGVIDLHGFTQIAARSALVSFLSYHRAEGAKCVLVITGKGKLGEGVIKKRVLDWLAQSDLRIHVSSYAQSHQKHGGAGAYYVFLRRHGPKI